MIKFFCTCGAPVFFDSNECKACQTKIAFNPITLRFHPIDRVSNKVSSIEGQVSWDLCENGIYYNVCNWLRPSHAESKLCFACQFNRYIPNLSRPNNIRLWRVLELNKRHLLINLITLEIPCINFWDCPEEGFLFDFLEDFRDGPEGEATFVTTGYAGGVITINTLEAEPLSRVAQQQASNEVYRTVLGHMRHEIGHHFFQCIKGDQLLHSKFEQKFGSTSLDYNNSLAQFYDSGPDANWSECCITAYASAHPMEDWAETWSHYLHIYDALDTAFNFGLVVENPNILSLQDKISHWRQLSVALNEMNRSMGMSDIYPFVINSKVEAKLEFVEQVINYLRNKSRNSVSLLPLP